MSAGTTKIPGRRVEVTRHGAGAVRKRPYVGRFLQYLAILLGIVVSWVLAARITANEIIMPSPGSVAEALVDASRDGTLWDAAQTSLTRLAMGYGIAVLVCVPLGVAMGLSRTARALLDPIVELTRPISGLAWIPLALLLFGVGDTLVVFIIFYGAIFPIVVNTAAGIRDVDQHLVAASKTFGVSKLTTFFHVMLPGALPTILVGLRTASGTAWMSLVAAELVGGSAGLGFSLNYNRELLMSNLMVGYILAIAGLGFLTNLLLRSIEKRATPWAQEQVR